MLLSGLTLAMAWSARSDMLINGYYRNFRGSFYAADSGVNIMRQALSDEFTAGSPLYPTGFTKGVNPLAGFDDVGGTSGKLKTNLETTYGTKNLTTSSSGVAAKSWPEDYSATISVKLVFCSAKNAAGTPTDCVKNAFPADGVTADYRYAYKITSTGHSRGTGNTVLTDEGLLQVTANLNTPVATNFAGFGMFIDAQVACPTAGQLGGDLVLGAITGPVFTNGGWTFQKPASGKPNYTFTDIVQQVDANAGFDNNGCVTSNLGTANGVTPPFVTEPASVNGGNGFEWGANGGKKVALPANTFQQAQAVLDGKGSSATSPTSTNMNTVLKDAQKNPYSDPAPGTGVFLPYNVDASGVATFTGGGIMVRGDASVVLQPIGTTGQQYTITQGGVPTTIVVDNTANTTVMTTGTGASAKTVTILGVPQQKDPGTGNVIGPATMLYVDGNITQLTGPGEGKAAIQDHTMLTITAADNYGTTAAGTTTYAAKNITITGDIKYKTAPVDANDNLVAAGDNGQALGIFTPQGNVQLKNSQTGDNLLEIDASIATISQGGSGGIVNTGTQIKTLTILGGRIQNHILSIGADVRNVLFDKRFGANFAPPWFPSTGLIPGVNGGGILTPKVTRLQWLNQNSTY